MKPRGRDGEKVKERRKEKKYHRKVPWLQLALECIIVEAAAREGLFLQVF